jgi:hypothetical protein
LEDDPVGRLKVFVYELPRKYNKKILQKNPRCLTHVSVCPFFLITPAAHLLLFIHSWWSLFDLSLEFSFE